MAVTLYPDQEALLQQAREASVEDGVKGVLMVAPCGWGKGAVTTHIMESAVSKGKSVHWLVNRKELVKDASRRLYRLGVKHGVIMGDWQANYKHPIQVVSIDTIDRRKNVPKADLLILDEAHFAISDRWFRVVNRYEGALRLGLTATPVRADGRGLGHKGMFQRMVVGPSLAEMIAVGRLTQPRTFAPSKPDLTGVDKSSSSNDYNKNQLSEVMRKPKLVGDIVTTWKQKGVGPTVVFACDVAHSMGIRDAFREAGVQAEHADADTPSGVRDKLWEDLAAYRLQVVVSVGIISYGWDVPECTTGILARPTASLALYLQQVGRLLRKAKGKDFAIILDHAGNSLKHGLPEDDRTWSLDDGLVEGGGKKDEESLRMCAKCFFMYPSAKGRVCPDCGHENETKARKIETVEGELQEVKPERYFRCEWCDRRGRLRDHEDYTSPCPACGFGPLRPLASKYESGKESEVDKREKYIAWFCEGHARGYKPGWAGMKYKQIYGTWPRREWMRDAQMRAEMASLSGGVAQEEGVA